MGGFNEAAEATLQISNAWMGQASSIKEKSKCDGDSGDLYRMHVPPPKGSSTESQAIVAKQEELTLLILQEILKILVWGEVGVCDRDLSQLVINLNYVKNCLDLY